MKPYRRQPNVNNTANLGEDERMFQTKVDLKVLGYPLVMAKRRSPKVTKEKQSQK